MRRPFDAYFTPASAVESLVRLVDIRGRVIECCSGDGAIVRPLLERGCEVFMNDLNPEMTAHLHDDAASVEFWQIPGLRAQWVVSNPPFNVSSQIVPKAFHAATKGVAMLLRLSFLEPCEDRAEFLSQHPPTTLIVLPRISFTNDGKTDSVTCAWMVWEKQQTQQRIVIEPKAKKAKAAA